MKRLAAVAAIAFGIFGSSVAQASTIHTALPGEGLWNIGAQHQVPYTVIKRANSLSSDSLRVGQFLKIPDKYVVRSGDSLWSISQRYGLSLTQVRAVNNIWGSSLNAGQVIYLPTPVRPLFTLSAADLDLFERLVSAESKGEIFAGQVAVANVVINRVKSPDFPDTVREVILQYYGSVPAFSPVHNGQINEPAVPTAKEAVRIALLGQDYSLGALFFYNPDLTSPNNWIRSRTVTRAFGNHLFAK